MGKDAPKDKITIRGARTHNLKGIDVDIPHHALVVVSGVSGSGKSSLAFDTVYAEGQRRYVESLSAYARQFLERMEKPSVDSIDGLAPAIAIRQKNQTRNPRSTVATATEIYDYLRLLYARCGTVTCLHCGGIVRRDTVDEIVTRIFALAEGTRLYALFPVVRSQVKLEALREFDLTANPGEDESSVRVAKTPSKKAGKAGRKTVESRSAHVPGQEFGGEWMRQRLGDLRRRGYNRLWQAEASEGAGRIVEFSTPESLLELDFAASLERPIYVLVDRLALSPDLRPRIVDAIETGYREAGEIVFRTVARDGGTETRSGESMLRYSAAYKCSDCHRAYREPEPSLFSFNNPYGACPRCQGFGNTIDFDPNLIVPNPARTLDEGAIDPWTKPKYRSWQGEMRRAAKAEGIPLDVPWFDLSEGQRRFIEEGGAGSGPSPLWPGIRGFFAELERKKYKLHIRVFLSRYRGYALCPDCRGQRLRAEARAVLLEGKNLSALCAFTIVEAREFLERLKLSPAQQEIAGKVLEEVRQRVRFLQQVGLEYLTLDRLSSTLSGGESQRIQLAASLGSRLVGALYVLDEPSIGLHARDTAKLIQIMEDLRDLGNTILVVEHDPEVIRAADHLLDLGPGAGELGGELLAAGSPDEVKQIPTSLTGRYLSGRSSISVPRHRLERERERLLLKGARVHNLRGVDVEIPLGLLCCVTGVSGSGKSTLVHQVLYRALLRALGKEEGGQESANLYREISGSQYLNDVVLVDQSPIGRTPRSNPVTYIKAFDAIRELFAAQPDARRKGLTAGSFSFNVPAVISRTAFLAACCYRSGKEPL